MYYLTIGVSPSVFMLRGKQNYRMTQEEKKLQYAIDQHELILSERIIEYYKSETKVPELVDSMIDALGYQQGIVKYVKPDKDYADGKAELVGLVSKCECKILVAEKNDIKPYSDKNICLVSPSKYMRGARTELNKYVFPVYYQVSEGTKIESIAKWLAIFFKGEKKISIQDKYILNDRGIYSLEHIYLPMFERDSEIDIYCEATEDCGYRDIKKAAQNKMFDEHNVNIYYCDKMKHDRYIELSKILIKIGAGLDLLGSECYIKESKECGIDIYRDEARLTKPNVIEKIR